MGPQGPASLSYAVVDSSNPPQKIGVAVAGSFWGATMVARQIENKWVLLPLVEAGSGFFQDGFVAFASSDCSGPGMYASNRIDQFGLFGRSFVIGSTLYYTPTDAVPVRFRLGSGIGTTGERDADGNPIAPTCEMFDGPTYYGTAVLTFDLTTLGLTPPFRFVQQP